MNMTHTYHVRLIAGLYPALARFGEPCRVLCGDGYVEDGQRVTGRGNILIEFTDGLRTVTSRFGVRRRKDA